MHEEYASSAADTSFISKIVNSGYAAIKCIFFLLVSNSSLPEKCPAGRGVSLPSETSFLPPKSSLKAFS